MDRNTIIDGLKMTRDLCVFDPSTGEEIEPHLLNDINRATYDACKGALEILEQLGTDGDTISRRAAIDAFIEHCYLIRYDHNSIEKGMTITGIRQVLEQLPSAQPEINCSEFPNNSDTISRQAAIDALSQMQGIVAEKGVRKGISMAWEQIKELPPAQPNIIRCRNCKFASGDSRICMKFDHSPIGELDFCAWAERRTDEV